VLVHGGALIDVVFDGGKPTPVVVKEQQRHPVRGSVVHVDLLEVKLDEEIEADVPVELVGAEEAPGVDEGGVLEHVTRELTIRALPTAIPDSIVADVSGMAINDTLQLSALVPPEGVEFVADEPDEVTIATLSPPRIEEEPEPEVEEEAELVGEEGEEGEAAEAPEGEAPEGEAPAEPEGGDSEGE
jgi:large subunit ribosomal protein L25